MRASLPTDGIGMQAPPVADVAASVDTGIGIQNFFVPTLTGRSNSIGVSGNRCGIAREENCRTGIPLGDEGENAVIGIVQVDPFESGITIIVLRKSGLALVNIIEMLDQTSKAIVQGIMEEVPIDALVVIPLQPLADLASHE